MRVGDRAEICEFDINYLQTKVSLTRSPSGACNFHTASVKRRFHK